MNGARLAWLALALQLLCGWLPALAADPAPLILGGDLRHALDGHLSYLKEDGPIAEMAGRDFPPATARQPGIATGVLWYRFTVLRPAGTPGDWVLAFGEPDIDDVRVYAGGREFALGRRIPSAELPLAARRHVVPLSLPEGEPLTVHLRLSSVHKIRFEDAALWRPGALMFDEARRSAWEGVQTGVMAVILIVYALCGLWLRDVTMLVYAAFVATTLSRHLTHSGIAPLLFTGSGGGANYLLGGVGLLGGISAFIFLWDRVLDLKVTFPAVHRLYAVAGVAVLAPLLWVTTPTFSLLVLPAQMTMLAASLGSVALAAVLARRHPSNVLLRFYLFAFLPIVLAWGVEIASLLSPAVPADLGRTLTQFATLAHMAILSVALAYRFGLILRQREEMRKLATMDALTGLANRRHFLDHGAREVKRCRRHGGATAVLLLDIDDFKRVNDTWGHAAGDRVLQALAHLMIGMFRQQDTVGRLGGEEFAALLPETNQDEALLIAERLRAAVGALATVAEAGQTIRFTVSIGVAILEDADTGIEEVLNRADRALYVAKGSGRNRVAV